MRDPDKTSSTGSGPEEHDRQSAEQLRLELRQRDERLSELTDQSLDLLDRLTEVRERLDVIEKDRDNFATQCDRLKQLLADARRRVRVSRSLHLVGDTRPTRATVEIVLWAPEGEADLAWARECIKSPGKVTITLIVSGGSKKRDLKGVADRVLEADGSRPAHLWNLAMASTEAPVVLFVSGGLQISRKLLTALRALDDEAVALVQPVLVLPSGAKSLGVSGDENLELNRSLEVGKDSYQDLQYLAPEVFAVRRHAHETVGPFDEDLAGVFALVDYCIRARDQNLKLVGLSSEEVSLPEPADQMVDLKHLERDRLVVLASRRPDHVGSALADSRLFRDSDAPESADLVRALLHRFPDAPESERTVELLTQLVQGLAQKVAVQESLPDHLATLEEEVARLGKGSSEVDAAPPADIPARISRLVALIQSQADIRESLEESVREVREEQVRMEEQREGLIQRINDLELGEEDYQSALEKQTAQFEKQAAGLNSERESALENQAAQFEKQAAGLNSERESALENQAVQFEKQAAGLNSERESALENQVAQFEKQVADLNSEHEAALRRVVLDAEATLSRERESALGREQILHQKITAIRKDLNDREANGQKVEKERHALHEQVAEVRYRLRATREELERYRQEASHEELSREDRRSAQLESMAAVLGLPENSGVAGIVRGISDIQAALEDRERWVAQLLGELSRRWVPRKLYEHEQEFLEQREQEGDE